MSGWAGVRCSCSLWHSRRCSWPCSQQGPVATAQTTLYGLVAGSYFALGAIGLTLVYGVLKLVNFAHGDMLTFGAYAALVANATLGLPFVVAVVVAIVATALLGVAFELSLWRPMRRGASTFQLLLMTIGLALLVRNGIQFFAGSGMASFDIDITPRSIWANCASGACS